MKVFPITVKIILLILVFMPVIIFSQKNRNINQQIETAEIIISGVVKNKSCYLGEDGYIKTKNSIIIQNIYKGASSSNITIVTKGGELNGKIERWSHEPGFILGEQNIFFLNANIQENQFDDMGSYKLKDGSFSIFSLSKEKKVVTLKSHCNTHYDFSDFKSKIENNEAIIEEYLFSNSNCIIYRIEPYVAYGNINSNSTIILNLYVSIDNGLSNLNTSSLMLDYSTEWLGENVVTNGNLKGVCKSNFKKTILYNCKI